MMRICRERDHPARAIDLYPCPRPARPDGRARLDDAVAQSAALRHGGRIDGCEKWLIHNHLNREDETFESVDRDASIRAILGVGPDFEFEILSKEDWGRPPSCRRQFRRGRAFICATPAHLWMPMPVTA